MNSFSKISEILGSEALNKHAKDFAIKKSVAFGFWKNITGARFSKFSAPYDIKGTTLFVSVKNPQVMQELMLYQDMILSKINNYFLPLDISINSIRYTYKNWNRINSSVVLNGDDTIRVLEDNEIEEVALESFEREELKKVTNTISKMDFLSTKLKTKYLKTMENSLKARKIQVR